MLGAVLVVVGLVLFVPVVLMSCGVLAGVLGSFLTDDAERRFEGSELLGLDR